MDSVNNSSSLPIIEEKSWYKDGLYFHCTGCGKCCRGPGYVWLTEEDIYRLSGHFQMSKKQFLKKYTRQVGDKFALLDQPNMDCIFLKNQKECSLYEQRPKQCRAFPWWKDQLRSMADWEEAAKHCEGINHPDAPLVSVEEIEKKLT